MGELADALGCRGARRHRSNALETRGPLTRSPGRYDRRGVLPRLTCAGRVRVSGVLTTYAREILAHYLDLSREKMLALADTCRAINAPLTVKCGTDEFKRT